MRFCSIMTQLLQIFPRNEFQQEVQKTKAERHARGFASWDQFVAMLYCQLGDAQSLREIIGGLANCEGRLEQWGVITPPSRSTLAYANKNRPWQLFQNVFYRMLERCRAELGHQTKFRFKNPLLSIDSTVACHAQSRRLPPGSDGDHDGHLLGADDCAPAGVFARNNLDHG
jgi:hypothetical protein